MKSYISYSGYIAALSTVILFYALAWMKIEGVISTITNPMILSVVMIVFILMLSAEILMKRNYRIRNDLPLKFTTLSNSNRYLFRSAFYRYIALLGPLLLAFIIVNYSPYFKGNQLFLPTVLFFQYILIGFVFLAPPYIFLTLKYRGDLAYEFNDYAMLTIIAFKSLGQLFLLKKQKYMFLNNRRVKKVFLVYLVNFFFITLMVGFISNEFNGFAKHFEKLFTDGYFESYWYTQARSSYYILFHTLFIVDVTIGIIGYISASRWLDNRTISVDMTFSGWFVALFCYPPFNSFFHNNLLPYDSFETSWVASTPEIWAFLFVVLLFLYTIYVWGTITLGFKFSNLTNRGIVTHGPYKYVRHPAYSAKNIAWLIEYNFIFSNIFAALLFFGWNLVYILRAVTEERHLMKDKVYRAYRKNVRYMFIPKVI